MNEEDYPPMTHGIRWCLDIPRSSKGRGRVATVRLLVTRVTALSARLGWCASSRPGYSGYSEPGGYINIFITVQVIIKRPPTRGQLIVTSHQSLFMHFF